MEGNEEQTVESRVSEDEKRDIKTLTEYIEELKKRHEWREDLRKQNSDLSNRLEEGQLRKLDSSLKKVTLGLIYYLFTVTVFPLPGYFALIVNKCF